MKKQSVLALSGGMDSSTLLLYLLEKGHEVTALSFDYGQKHSIELERAQQLIDYLREKDHDVNYQKITLQGLFSLLNFFIIASFNSFVPLTGVYFVWPSCIALIAAFFTLSGVSKSGSPAEKSIIFFPSCFNFLVFAVIDIVGDACILDTLCEKKPITFTMYSIINFRKKR